MLELIKDKLQTPSLPPGVTHRAYWVRHGEPTAFAKGKVYGKLDVSLSERGRNQVRALNLVLAPALVDCVFSSPRRRAYESADIFAKPRGLCVAHNNDLAEIDFGDIEGKSYDEVKAQFPELYKRWMSQPTSVTFPGGESYTDLKARVSDAAKTIREACEGQSVAVFVHGGVIRAILATVLDMPDDKIFRLGQDYAGLTCIDYYGDEPVVRVMNLTDAEAR